MCMYIYKVKKVLGIAKVIVNVLFTWRIIFLRRPPTLSKITQYILSLVSPPAQLEAKFSADYEVISTIEVIEKDALYSHYSSTPLHNATRFLATPPCKTGISKLMVLVEPRPY